MAVELVVDGVTTRLAQDVTDSKATHAINTGNFVAGVMGWFGYIVTAVYLFIAVAFGYFQFIRPAG